MESTSRRTLLAGATIFIGSMLAFWLQLMAGRVLLPVFGSSASVWIVCLGTFQLLLLGGYAYGFVLSRLPWRRQRAVHLVVLVLAVAWVVVGGLAPRPPRVESPWLAVLGVLLETVGLAFVALSSGSLLLQNWASRGSRDRGVYKLYAWSNAGSFAGLAIYPLVLEPLIGLSTQRLLWTCLFGAYALLVAVLAFREGRSQTVGATGSDAMPEAAPTPDHDDAISLPSGLTHAAWWFILPALSSALLVAITNRVTLEFTPLPLMWAVLLGAFLLSYVIAFRGWAERHLGLLTLLAGATLAVTPFCQLSAGYANLALGIAHGSLLLLLGGSWLHAWLYTIRPHAGRLAYFYLANALGGATGGLLVTFVPVLVFSGVTEYPLMITGVMVLVAAFTVLGGARVSTSQARLLLAGLLAVPFIGIVMVARRNSGSPERVILKQRSFYGVVSVREAQIRTDRRPEGSVMRTFMHGATVHGQQALLPEWRTRPTTYFTPHSGIGQCLLKHPKRNTQEPMHVGVVGLGIGTLAAYARPGDVYTWYEINPQVVAIATNAALFTFMADCRAVQHVVTADARKAIEFELTLPDTRPFDVLVMDAFSSDAPPLHLATREAFALYARRMTDDGILAVNISNAYLALAPLCKRLGAAVGLNHIRVIAAEPASARLQNASIWVLLSSHPMPFKLPTGMQDADQIDDAPMITDDKGSALSLVRFRSILQAF